MGKRILLLVLAVVFVVSLSGCSTVCKNKDLEIQGLRNQVSALESQLSAKNEEVSKAEQAAPVPSESTLKTIESKQRPSPRQIQTALKNAGYYQGVIDSKLGKKTRQAVKDFQKANNLSADGRVGKKTWALLKDYLEKKIK